VTLKRGSAVVPAPLTQVNAGPAYRRFVFKCGTSDRSIPMLDVIMLAIAFAFFAVSIAYVYACDQL
jgi:hypothetical protein